MAGKPSLLLLWVHSNTQWATGFFFFLESSRKDELFICSSKQCFFCVFFLTKIMLHYRWLEPDKCFSWTDQPDCATTVRGNNADHGAHGGSGTAQQGRWGHQSGHHCCRRRFPDTGGGQLFFTFLSGLGLRCWFRRKCGFCPVGDCICVCLVHISGLLSVMVIRVFFPLFFVIISSHIRPLTVRVFGAPQMISQLVSSIFPL